MRRARRVTRWTGGVGCVAIVGLVLSACSSGSPSASTTTTSTATSTAPANMTLPAITKAVVRYQNSQGVAPGRYRISSIVVSTVDPTWAKFSIAPTSADRATFQGGYGFVHRSGDAWRVVGFGSAEVGCPLTGPTTPSAATYVTVPPAVLAAFSLSCPPGGPSTTTSTGVTTTTAGSQAALSAAVNRYQQSQGIAPAQYTITSLVVSTVDPTWAKFSIGPTPADQNNFQGGYGFAQMTNGTWQVVGFGSAEVGCPPGATGNAVVPTAVLSGFGQTCPPPVTGNT